MRGWITFLGIMRFCLFYFGFISKCREMNPNQKSSFLSEGDGMCCEKCHTVMKYYPKVVIAHKTHPDASTVGHRWPRALGGKNGGGWIQHECKLCNGAHGNVLAELIQKYGDNVHDVPFFVLLKFVIYSIGEFNDSKIRYFSKNFESEYQRHLQALRKKAAIEKVASEKRRREAQRVSRAQAIIDEARRRDGLIGTTTARSARC